jgi:hypothetical protein
MVNRGRHSVRCSCVCADGSPCGRRVTDGSQPPICHVHRAVAAGTPHNGGTVNKRRSMTPEQVLEDLLRSKDDSVRLRAADVFLKRQEREMACPRCAAAAERDEHNRSAIHRLTYEQRGQLRELIQTVRSILESARTQPLMWDPDVFGFRDEPSLDTPYQAAPADPSAIIRAPEEMNDGHAQTTEYQQDPDRSN